MTLLLVHMKKKKMKVVNLTGFKVNIYRVDDVKSVKPFWDRAFLKIKGTEPLISFPSKGKLIPYFDTGATPKSITGSLLPFKGVVSGPIYPYHYDPIPEEYKDFVIIVHEEYRNAVEFLGGTTKRLAYLRSPVFETARDIYPQGFMTLVWG